MSGWVSESPQQACPKAAGWGRGPPAPGPLRGVNQQMALEAHSPPPTDTSGRLHGFRVSRLTAPGTCRRPRGWTARAPGEITRLAQQSGRQAAPHPGSTRQVCLPRGSEGCHPPRTQVRHTQGRGTGAGFIVRVSASCIDAQAP